MLSSASLSMTVGPKRTIDGRSEEDWRTSIGENSDMRTCVIINIVRVIVKMDVDFSKGGHIERF